jgi:O-antigen ligase
MLRNIRESLVLFLIVILPFHAFLITIGTKLMAGAGQAPLSALALWKESLLVFILLFALLEIAGRNPKFQIDLIDGLVLVLVVLGLIIPSSNFIFGFKYTLFPLCLFLILRRVLWSEKFIQRAWKLILVVGGGVAGYGIITFFLPQDFFVWLGYSDLHSLYVPEGPLAAFQHIGGTGIRRIQSTMSGPNQLGMWLLIPFGVIVSIVIRRRIPEYRNTGIFGILCLALFLTFSRAAWLVAITLIFVGIWIRLPKMMFLLRYCATALLAFVVVCSVLFPNVFLRITSTREHIQKPLEAIQTIIQNPLGLGLGSAGPASNRVSDTCVYLEEGADASWAEDRPDLCVFSGNVQIQPDAPCHCPFLPENWYLQVGVELGLLGFVLFIILIILLLRDLFKISVSTRDMAGRKNYQLTSSLFLSFLGISVSALFLHSWEDSAVAYTVWILVAMMFPCMKDRLSSLTLADSTRISLRDE